MDASQIFQGEPDNYDGVTVTITEPMDASKIFQGEPDNYDGVTVTIAEPMDAAVFTEKLRASLSHWRQEGKKGIWINLPIRFANLVEAAVSEGFRYHHAEPDYLMLVSWIPNTRDTIPANASHVVGVGALVLNKNTGEVLVVQEKSGYFRNKNVWKLPTGVVNEIVADFVEVLSFRQSHKAFLKKKSDLFFLCALTPRSYEIIEQKSEILEAKPLNQNQEMFKYMANICQKKCEEEYLGFSTVETTTGTGKKSFVYCNADHAMSLNAARDQASSSH
uniref:Nudix hydrolase n=1 Tax=Brassica campestris TaxID=3711 RepID=M4EXI4_BRACM